MPVPTRHPKPVYLRWSIWFTYVVLFTIAIPWYWSRDSVHIVFGVPLWAAVSIGGSALISVFTAWLLIRFWPMEEEDGSEDL